MAVSESRSIRGAAATTAAVVMMLATMGGGAEAQFNIKNQSRTMVAISTGAGKVIIGSNSTLHLSCPTASFLVGDVNITLHAREDRRHLISLPVPAQDVAFLSSLFGLNTLIIARNRSCVSLTVTFTVLSHFSLPLGSICPPRRTHPNLKSNLKLTGAYRTENWLPTLPLPEPVS